MSCLTTSQTINLSNTKEIYYGLIQGDQARKDLTKCITSANELNAIVQDQNDSIIAFAIRQKALNNEIANYQVEAQKIAVALEQLKNKKLPWYKNQWYYLLFGFFSGIYLAK